MYNKCIFNSKLKLKQIYIYINIQLRQTIIGSKTLKTNKNETKPSKSQKKKK